MASWLCSVPKEVLEPITINTTPKPKNKMKYAPMAVFKAESKTSPKSINRPNLGAIFGI
jgi:hypothetical protein